MVAIAITPWDRHLGLHKMLVRATFGALFAYVVCLCIVLAQNGWPRVWMLIDLGSLALLGAYIVSFLIGPDLTTLAGVRFQATSQKVVVCLSILVLVAQAIKVRQAARAPASLPELTTAPSGAAATPAR